MTRQPTYRHFPLLLALLLLGLSPFLAGCPCGCQPPPEPEYARLLSGETEKTYKLALEVENATDTLPAVDRYRHTFVEGGLYRLTETGVGTNAGTWHVTASGDSLYVTVDTKEFAYDGPTAYALLHASDSEFRVQYHHQNGATTSRRVQTWRLVTK